MCRKENAMAVANRMLIDSFLMILKLLKELPHQPALTIMISGLPLL
jgi:hypothetical protein